MRLRTLVGFAIAAAVAVPCSGQVLLDNTLIVTHAGQGFNGADASAIMASASPGATLYGANCGNAPFRVADDFVVPAGATWNITKIVVYSYQTNAANPFPPVSTYTGLTIRIWNGAPNAGGVVAFGDTTTNRLSASGWTNAYRTTDGDIGTAFNRAIMRLEASFNPAIVLGAGTYWLDYGATGTVASGPWTPPQVRGPLDPTPGVVIGNAIQQTVAGVPGTWQASVNGTAGQCAYSFNIEGTLGGCYPDCNLDGALTVADFGCFQTAFVGGNMYADCNGDGALTVPDFGCFQTKFVTGCP